MEIVLIDDRSNDGTRSVISAIAAREPRVRAIHIDRLPEGWLGKVHALYIGTREARGDWLLFTDADVHFRPGTLRKAVALALHADYDHLAILPHFHHPTFWQEVVGGTFERGALVTSRAVTVGKPGSRAFVGVGAFNLVRKSKFDQTKGFSWLRMEVVDDLGLAFMLQKAGARGGFAVGIRDIALTWYPSLSAMFLGLEKNAFALARYSILRLAVMVSATWLLVAAPLLALWAPNPWLRITGIAHYCLTVVTALIWCLRYGKRFLPSLLQPVGMLLLSLMALWSGARCRLRGGISWRGTRYPLQDLRMGQRVK